MMGTYCTFCRVAGPDIFDPPEHLPTCRYYPVEAKSRDKTIQQLSERIKELERQLSCRTDKLSFRGNTVSHIYDKAKCYGNQLALAGRILSEHNLMDEFEERWNRVGSTKELSELQQAEQIGVLKAHIKREESLGEDFARKYKQLKAENQRLKTELKKYVEWDEAATPQKESNARQPTNE